MISLDIAQRKAWTAAATGVPTADFISQDPPLASGMTVQPGLVTFGGGVPVVVGGDVVGALGISGGHNAEDMRVAAAALAACGLS